MRNKYVVLLSLLAVLLILASLWGVQEYRGRLGNDLVKKTRSGDSTAEFELAKLYQSGEKNFPKDSKAAFDWYSRAAAQGNPKAQNNLGLMYAKGEAVTKNDVEAFQWFQKAAIQGDAVAERIVAAKYLQGTGVPQNYSEAVGWFRKAAERGDVPAQVGISLMYARGVGVQRDPVVAYAWILVAQASGNERIKKLSNKLVGRLQKQLSSAQILEAQNLASSWWASRQKGTMMPEYSQYIRQAGITKQAPALRSRPTPAVRTSRDRFSQEPNGDADRRCDCVRRKTGKH